MICDHAGCRNEATVRTRFGDGHYGNGRDRHRQTYVYYCDPCYQTTAALFRLTDVGLIRRKDEPHGPSRPTGDACMLTSLRV